MSYMGSAKCDLCGYPIRDVFGSCARIVRYDKRTNTANRGNRCHIRNPSLDEFERW